MAAWLHRPWVQLLRWRSSLHRRPDMLGRDVDLPRMSPTLSQLGRAFTFQLVVSQGWAMCLGDIQGAFLEAGPIQEKHR
jgi:hypothetical protein